MQGAPCNCSNGAVAAIEPVRTRGDPCHPPPSTRTVSSKQKHWLNKWGRDPVAMLAAIRSRQWTLARAASIPGVAGSNSLLRAGNSDGDGDIDCVVSEGTVDAVWFGR